MWRKKTAKLVRDVIEHLKCADHTWRHEYEESESGNVRIRRVLKRCLLGRLLPCCNVKLELVVRGANIDLGPLVELRLKRAWLTRRAHDAHENATFTKRGD